MRTAIRRAVLPLLLVTLVLALGGLAARAEPPDPYFDTHLGPVPERPVQVAPGQPGGEGGLLDWSDIDWAPWVDGLTANPLWATLAALAALGISLANRTGWARAAWETVGGIFSLSWNAVRQSQAGWIVTEILRRASLPWVGAGIWAVKQVVALPGAAKDLFIWLGETTGENIKTVVSFVRADSQGRGQIVADQMERARSAWEAVKAFPGLLWDETKSRWSRGWNGLVRMWTDPDVSNQELLQWGADHASMATDAAIVAPVVSAAARGVRGASWFARVSGRVGRMAEAIRISGLLRDWGYADVTAYRVWRVMQAAEREIKLTELISALPRNHRNTLEALIRAGHIQWTERGMLRGVGGSLRPWKVAKTLVDGDEVRLNQMMNQVHGGLGQIVAREFIEHEPGFQRWVLQARNPSQPGLDMMAEFLTRFEVVEVKNVSGVIGGKGVSTYVEFADEVYKFDPQTLLANIEKHLKASRYSKREIDLILSKITSGQMELVYRIEAVGDGKVAGALMKLNGTVVDGVKIIINSR